MASQEKSPFHGLVLAWPGIAALVFAAWGLHSEPLQLPDGTEFDWPAFGELSGELERERLLVEDAAHLSSAVAETKTRGFLDWAGGEHTTLAIVFTDVVASTALGEELGDQLMNAVRRAHFDQGRKLLHKHEGREIKTIGDSLMAAFHSVSKALDFGIEFHKEPGHQRVTIRVGLHIGPVHVQGDDTFGGTVNFAARVVGAIKGAEVWLSDRAKKDIDQLRAREHQQLVWGRRDGIEMKGLSGSHTLWALENPPHRT